MYLHPIKMEMGLPTNADNKLSVTILANVINFWQEHIRVRLSLKKEKLYSYFSCRDNCYDELDSCDGEIYHHISQAT